MNVSVPDYSNDVTLVQLGASVHNRAHSAPDRAYGRQVLPPLA
ncbi:hypothetical protein RSAG8_09289, partial [Rhizoctonia solani AG-8 WAC10335]